MIRCGPRGCELVWLGRSVTVTVAVATAGGRLVFVQARWFVVYHARTPFNRSYNQHRQDIHPDLQYLGGKWR